jgi:hypothetical protein
MTVIKWSQQTSGKQTALEDSSEDQSFNIAFGLIRENLSARTVSLIHEALGQIKIDQPVDKKEVTKEANKALESHISCERIARLSHKANMNMMSGIAMLLVGKIISIESVAALPPEQKYLFHIFTPFLTPTWRTSLEGQNLKLAEKLVDNEEERKKFNKLKSNSNAIDLFQSMNRKEKDEYLQKTEKKTVGWLRDIFDSVEVDKLAGFIKSCQKEHQKSGSDTASQHAIKLYDQKKKRNKINERHKTDR